MLPFSFTRALNALRTNSRTQRRRSRAKYYGRPVCGEVLEARTLLTTFFVDGDVVGPGSGTDVDPFNTIQAAIDAAAASSGDDAVAINAGTYSETLQITDTSGSLILTGVSGDSANVIIQNSSAEDTIEIVGAMDVQISNVTVVAGDGLSRGGNRAVWIHDSFGIQSPTGGLDVRNVTIRDHIAGGIVAERAGDIFVSNSEITNNNNGIYTFSVGDVTLSDVNAANNNRDGAQINSATSLTLSGGAYDDNPIHGLFVSNTANVNLSNTTFDRNGDNGVDLRGTTTVAVTDVSVNGNGSRGSIDGLIVTGNGARDVTLTRVTASGNTAAGFGLRAVSGSVTATDVRAEQNTFVGLITQNHANNVEIDGGVFASNGNRGLYLGGFASAAINDVTVSGNGSSDNGQTLGGAGIHAVSNASGATFDLTQSVIENNTTSDVGRPGGGLLVVGTLRANIDSVLVAGNTATNSGEGGGIFFAATGFGSVIRNATIRNNSGGRGGGLTYGSSEVTPAGSLVIEDSTIDNNIADTGAGIYHQGANLLVRRSTISNNTATSTTSGGGGVFVNGSGQIENSTISGDTSNRHGGGVAIIDNSADFRLYQVTVTNNQAALRGGGVSRFGANNSVTIANSIFAGNQGLVGSPDFHGAAFSLGFNLIGDGTGSTQTGVDAASDLVGDAQSPIDARLAPLADNGGVRHTHALLADSPAVDAIGLRTNIVFQTDQRGVARPQGTARDIGAFELIPQPNTPPTADGQNVDVAEDVEYSGQLTGADADGDSLVYQLVSGPTNHFSFSFFSSGRFTYKGQPNFNGSDSFSFRTYDGQDFSEPATVQINVTPVNDAPVANDDNYVLDEDSSRSGGITGPGPLDNDSDIDGDNLTAVLLSDVNHGQLDLNTNGTFTYTPVPDFNGTDSFTYAANDGETNSAPATVTFTVTPVEDNPTAMNDSATVDEDSSLEVSVLANDFDVDGDDISVVSVQDSVNGTAELSNGVVTFTPNQDFAGTAGFSYTIVDENGNQATASVTVTVNPVNDEPTSEDQEFSIAEDAEVGNVVGVVPGSDVDGDELTFSISSGNDIGTFGISDDGVITVADLAGLDFETMPTFDLTIVVSDGQLSTTSLVIVNVTDVEEEIPVRIDILPNDDTNSINLKKTRSIKVAIFSSSSFDATQIENDSLRFGATGTEDSLRRKGKHNTPKIRYEDIDGDGLLDLIAEFDVQRTGLTVDDTTATLSGTLADGQAIRGNDAVSVTNIRRGGKGRRK